MMHGLRKGPLRMGFSICAFQLLMNLLFLLVRRSEERGAGGWNLIFACAIKNWELESEAYFTLIIAPRQWR